MKTTSNTIWTGGALRPAARGLSLLCGWLAGLALGASSLSAATMTDAFAARPRTTGTTVNFDGNSTGATAEIGEPDHDGNRRRTVWGAWTAPGNGTAVVDTIGSGFNTVLAVYVGDTLTNLVPVARNQDLPESTWSRVKFPTKAGVTYSVAVDGQYANSSGAGAVLVNVVFTPASQPGAEVGTDVFAARPTLSSGGAALGVCNTRFYGLDVFEPARVSDRAHTAWWRWVAPGDGAVVIDTLESDFNTVLTVYAGTDFGNLSEVALSVDVVNGEQSQVTFQTRAGLEYQIMVDGQYANESGYGNVILHLAWAANGQPGAVPGGNAFARRGQLAGSNAEGVAMNWLFDTEPFEPDHGTGRRKTAWWEWTAPASGPVRIRTEGSDFNTHVVIYTGTSLSNLRLVAANDDVANGVWSDVHFQAQRGQGYLIMVDGHYANASGYGNIRLRVDQAVGPSETLAVYPAVEIELPGVRGVRYQIQASANLMDWADVGPLLTGAGEPIRVLETVRGTGNRYYRYLVVP
jgi:hypothetical protein